MQKIRSNTQNKFAVPIIIVVGIAGIGIYSILSSHAQSPYASTEVESGTLADGATLQTDSTASGDKDVLFGSSGSSYYVSPSGSDSNSGSQASPWLTIQKAVNTVPANSTIDLETGTYGGFTASKANVTITSAPNASPVIDGAADEENIISVTANYVTLSNFTVTGCVPNSAPASFEQDGSASIRATGASYDTMDNLTVENGHGINSYGLPFGCYGIALNDANDVTISNSNITNNGTGIFVNGDGENDLITKNTVYDNAYEIRDTPTSVNANDDFGSDGILFDGGGGLGGLSSPGPTATYNNIYGNEGPSADYGEDGGGFEIYQASNVTMAHNTISNNNGVLETGTNSGGNCVNNQFLDNTVSGRPSDVAYSTSTVSPGFILRCADDMVISGNTLDNLDYWTFDIESGGSFGGEDNGLTITNNTISQTTAEIYQITFDVTGLGITINNNTIHSGFYYFGKLPSGSYVETLANWTAATGFDANSTSD